MKKYWIAAIAAGLALALAVGAFVVGTRRGEEGRHEHRAPIVLQGRTVIDLGVAIDTATRQVPGDVLKVELENEDSRYVYEVKVLAQDGRVREVKLDAQDGSLIEIEDD